MKPLSSYSPHNPEKQFNRLKKVLNNLEKMQKTLEKSGETEKISSVSIKLLSSELTQAYSPKSHQKNSLKKHKSPSKPIAQNTLELTNEILDDKDPKNKKFLTESMMQTRPVYTALHQRKRQFGFNAPALPELTFSSYPASRVLLSRDVLKRLDAILYNNVYKNSQRSRKEILIKKIDETELGGFKKPVSSLSQRPVRESDKMEIGMEFKNLISQEGLENDLIKMKLAKHLLLREAMINH